MILYVFDSLADVFKVKIMCFFFLSLIQKAVFLLMTMIIM